VVLSDTPGILDPQYPMQERMMDAVNESLSDADILIVMVELGQRRSGRSELLKRAPLVQRAHGVAGEQGGYRR
jgi:GTP-binding protein Era